MVKFILIAVMTRVSGSWCQVTSLVLSYI